MMTPGSKAEQTRAHILDAAASLFAQHGFDGVSVRSIAREAGVDQALVHHYFGTKDRLFGAALEHKIDLGRIDAMVGDVPPEQLGRELVIRAEELWVSPARPALLALFRAGIASHQGLLRRYAHQSLIERISARLEGSEQERQRRAAFAVTQLVGFVLTRHLVEIEPLASLPIEDAVESIGSSIQRYLTGDLGHLPVTAPQ